MLLVDYDGQLTIGTPKVEGAKVTAKVLSHLKGDKVIIFKKKRRKTFERKNIRFPYKMIIGSKQDFTPTFASDYFLYGTYQSLYRQLNTVNSI